jgi:hypothetical protein
LVLAINSPGAVQQLANFDLGLGIRATVRTWRKIQNNSPDPNTVIIPHHRAITEADESIQIQLPGDLSPSLLRVFSSDGKTTVKSRDKSS